MTTTFPGAIDSYSLKVDNVTDVMAADVNDVQDAIVAIETAILAQSPSPNLLYHTLSHDIWPDGVTFNDVTDDSYVAGIWNAVHNGQNPDVSGEALIIDGSKRAIKCLFDSASSQAGFVQFLSNSDTVKLRGKTLSFSIDVSASAVVNMRCAILEWVGTADTITSDVVVTWGTGNPTLVTNWSYIDTPADQTISGTTRIKAEGKVVGATTTNLAVFVWTPDLEASTDYFRLANAKLEIGLTVTDFVAKNYQEELTQTQTFYEFPASATNACLMAMAGSDAAIKHITIFFATPKRSVPTVTTYDGAGNSGKITEIGRADNVTPSAVTAGTQYFRISSTTAGSHSGISINTFIADARL